MGQYVFQVDISFRVTCLMGVYIFGRLCFVERHVSLEDMSCLNACLQDDIF